jgi:hypothetical protein
VLAIAAGCARADWVGSTLVTVDVTGEWRGTYVRGVVRGSIAMKLEQHGAKVTGSFEFSSPGADNGRVAGTIGGDKLRLEGPGRLTGELTVGVDEMAGFLSPTAPGYAGGRLSVLLLRQ